MALSDLIEDPRTYEQIMYNFGNYISIIMSSGKLRDSASWFLSSTEDLDRVVAITKRMTEAVRYNGEWHRAMPDDDITRESVIDDTMDIYSRLDEITGGKHNLVARAKEHIPEMKFITDSNERSHIATNSDGSKSWVMNLEPLINTRTILAHELNHINDELTTTGAYNSPRNKFLGELSTIAIDHFGVRVLAEKYPEKIADYEYIETTGDFNMQIAKAKDSYLDYLICRLLTTHGDEQYVYINELVDCYDRVFSPRLIERKLAELVEVTRNPNLHFTPMMESRYIVANAIYSELEECDREPSEFMDKLLTINEHNVDLTPIRIEGDASTSTFDIVTNYLELPPLEDLVENYVARISRHNAYINSNMLGYDGM